MSTRPDPWPLVTEELLPTALFRLAKKYPDLVYAEFFSDAEDLAKGYRKVTFAELANAVHGAAWWIAENVGRPEKEDGSEAVVYLGPGDLRYGLLVFASVVTGYKILFPSPRYGAEAIAKLIEQVDGNILLSPDPPLPVVAELLEKRPMRTYSIPSLEHLLSTPSKPYPFTKTFAEHKHEPFVSLHTSGTTGFPKPILWTHDWANSCAHCLRMPGPTPNLPTATYVYGSKNRVLLPFPPFHASGVIGQTLFAICTGTTLVTPAFSPDPAQGVRLIANTLDFLGKGNIHLVALPPPHMEYLATQPELLDRIAKNVDLAMWGGGDISTAAGNVIAQKIRLTTDLGSTELGLWPSLQRTRDNTWNGEKVDEYWHFVPLHPALNIRLDIVASTPEGDIGEAIMTRNETGWIQPLFHVYQNDKERSLGDLFLRHPQHPDLWKYHGRVDDLLTFLTTEKFHPAVAEQRIDAHPAVEECMLVGTRRPKAALIMRLKEGRTLEDVWGVVEEVNEEMPVYARVERGMVVLVKEPFLRTPKGTVSRGGMLKMYGREVDEVYGAAV